MQPDRSNPDSGYRPINPFTPSVNYQRIIRNALRGSGIENIDDVPLPSLAVPQPTAPESPTNTEHGRTIFQIYQHSHNNSIIFSPTPAHSGNVHSQPSNHHSPEHFAPSYEAPGILVENSLALLPPPPPVGEQSRGGHFRLGGGFNTISQAAQNILVLDPEALRGRRQHRYQVLPSRSRSSSNRRRLRSVASSTRRRSRSVSSSNRFPSHSSRSPSPTGTISDVETGISPDSHTPTRIPAGSQTDSLGHFTFPDFLESFATGVLRQIYLHTLLCLPYLYFSRVDKIYLEVQLSLPEIKHMALEAGASMALADHAMDNPDTNPRLQTPAYQNLKVAWENFIDNLMKEWKITNVISALVLTAVMTLFQIQAISQDPVTRYLAFWSLFCALLSLLFGYMLILQFDTMRTPYKAAEWALETRNKIPPVFWNVWVMLSMPVVWLAWSALVYTLCILCFMWRSSANPPSSASPTTYPTGVEHGFRIFICLVLGIGITYGTCLVKTLRRYGSPMEKAWKGRIDHYLQDQALSQHSHANSGCESSGQAGQPSDVTMVVETSEQVDADLSAAYSISSHLEGEGRNSGEADIVLGESLSQTHPTNAKSREMVHQDIELVDRRTHTPYSP